VPTRSLLLTVALLGALVTGCSGDTGSGDTGSGTAGSGLPSQAQLQTYFTAVASYDVDGLQSAATSIAAEGSPAAAYALYQADIALATKEAGQQPGSFEAKPKGDGFEACGQDTKTCATWTDLSGKDGRLEDFQVNGSDVKGSLVDLTGQAPIDVQGLFTAQPRYAYLSPLQGTLYVTVQLTSNGVALQPDPAKALYVEPDVQLKGASTSVAGPISGSQDGLVTLTFQAADKAKLDGQVTFPVTVGGTSQSVGFGLSQ
jgi:hypothetical protein